MSLSQLFDQAGFTPEQRSSADIIAREFASAGYGTGITLAAIVNAYAESMLDPLVCFGRTPWGPDRSFGPIGGQENSCGLFQLNAAAGAAGDGMSVEQRQDPYENTARIIEVVNSSAGDRIRLSADEYAPLGNLIYLFTVDIERPADSDAKGTERSELARGWWGDLVDQPSSVLPALQTSSSSYFFFWGGLAALLGLLVLARQ
tara:strand:- start:2381 stop:2989 length:609 start_codon:yes stop_codon:yes gene_type:complete